MGRNGVMCTGGVVMFRHLSQFYGTSGVLFRGTQPDLTNSTHPNLKNRTTSQIPTTKPEKIQHKTPKTHSQSQKQTTTTNR